VVSAGGALGGFLLAHAELGLLKAFAPANVPRLDDAAVSLPAVLFAGLALVVVTLLVGWRRRSSPSGSGCSTG
jgi:MYXO-CTERM domain-containing protein